MKRWLLVLSAACYLAGGGLGDAARLRAAEPVRRDVTFAIVDGHSLKLDCYAPEGPSQETLIVWVHGGAWRAGSKSDMPLAELAARGYAIASVDYRLSPVAPFPAQVHDIKAAIRYLRANAKTLQLPTKRVVIAGGSAGGHLAALVGVTNGHQELEGTVGEHREASSHVDAIVSFYGMSNLTTILDQSTPHGLRVRVPALDLLLGGQPADKPDLARLASPVFHVDASDPPLLLLHGDQDPQAPINQSHELHGKYQAVKRPCEFVVLYGSQHGGREFFDAQRAAIVDDFLQRCAARK